MQSVADDEWIPSVCYMCFNACGILAHRVNGKLVKIEGDPNNPHNLGRTCAKGNAGIMSLYDPYRIKTPLLRTNPDKSIGADPKWSEISWDQALDILVDRVGRAVKDDPRKVAIYHFDHYAVQSVGPLAAAIRTPNQMQGGYFCGLTLHPVNYLIHGAFYNESDMGHCNYMILAGSQQGHASGDNTMFSTLKMAEARERGMKLIVVDPVCSNAASKADEWVPIRPGTDGAFALGMLNLLLNEYGIYDSQFLKKFTNGAYLIKSDGHYLRDKTSGKPLVWDSGEKQAKTYDDSSVKEAAIEGEYEVDGTMCSPAFQLLKNHVKKYTPEFVQTITTVPSSTLRRIAKEFGEAAKIGATISIDGEVLPWRPAHVFRVRGPTAHRNGFESGFALMLMNVVMGAVDVPGGVLGIGVKGNYPHLGGFEPTEGPDGLIHPPAGIRAGSARAALVPHPARKSSRPESLPCTELFPTTFGHTTPMAVVNLLNPEKFGLPYELEVLITAGSNHMMSRARPQEVAEAFRKIPFMVTFSRYVDETAEIADLVLPEVQYLERLEFFPNNLYSRVHAGEGEWYVMLMQPVVKPDPNVRHWVDVLYEVADRIGLRRDLYEVLNLQWNLGERYRLDSSRRYTWEELIDRRAKSMFGEEHGLEWFKKHGVMKWKKTVKEAFPRPFFKGRLHLYLEYLIDAGTDVSRVTNGMNLEWDTSEYRPLPDWRPCACTEESKEGYTLYSVNYKLPIATHSDSTQNPLLNHLLERDYFGYKILINTETANSLAMHDGDQIYVESVLGGKVRGEIKTTECIHPEVIGIPNAFGHWAKGMPLARGKGVHYNSLLTHDIRRISKISGGLCSSTRVKVYSATHKADL